MPYVHLGGDYPLPPPSHLQTKPSHLQTKPTQYGDVVGYGRHLGGDYPQPPTLPSSNETLPSSNETYPVWRRCRIWAASRTRRSSAARRRTVGRLLPLPPTHYPPPLPPTPLPSHLQTKPTQYGDVVGYGRHLGGDYRKQHRVGQQDGEGVGGLLPLHPTPHPPIFKRNLPNMDTLSDMGGISEATIVSSTA